MIDTDTFRIISMLASGYDPNTGKDIGPDGLQIDLKISRAFTRVLTEMRRKRHKTVCELNDEERELFTQLREYRRRHAQELDLQPYQIAHDTTLSEIAKLKPLSKEMLIGIYGLGQKRIDAYGEDFVSVVKGHLKSKETAGPQ